MKHASPRPWRHHNPSPLMSAVLDANGRLVAGSLICQQERSSVDNHALMVGAVNLLHAVGQMGNASSGKTENSRKLFKHFLDGNIEPV